MKVARERDYWPEPDKVPKPKCCSSEDALSVVPLAETSSFPSINQAPVNED